MTENASYAIVKVGSKPWWPAKIIDNSTSKNVFNVRLFVTNEEEVVDRSDVLYCLTKLQFLLTLRKMGADKCGFKYTNAVPDSMKDIYDQAWSMYENARKNEVEVINVDSSSSKSDEPDDNEEFGDDLCEICVRDNNLTSEATMNMRCLESCRRKCKGSCGWLYHRNCGKNGKDIMCGCQVGGLCGVCGESCGGPGNKHRFVCAVADCNRVFHRTCLVEFFNLNKNSDQCPHHSCLNCTRDCLVPIVGQAKKQPAFVFCARCHVTFHDDPLCLPAKYQRISKLRIICYRHFADLDMFQSTHTGFCFKCCSEVEPGSWASCKFCSVTYHRKPTCFPTSILLMGHNTFQCDNCRFPFCARAAAPVLLLPQSSLDMDSVYLWRLGLPVAPDYTSRPGPSVAICLLQNGPINLEPITGPLTHFLPITIFSLHHLICFSLLRSVDISLALNHISHTVLKIMDKQHLRLDTGRNPNSFLLLFSGILPLSDNAYRVPPELSKIPNFNGKCGCSSIYERGAQLELSCLAYSTCRNANSGRECTSSTCSLFSRCGNFGLQIAAGRPPLHLSVYRDKVNSIAVAVHVDKDILQGALVAELLGEVTSRAEVTRSQAEYELIFGLTETTALRVHGYCNITRFIHHNVETPNLVARIVSSAGIPKIGLYATRPLKKNCFLMLDMSKSRLTVATVLAGRSSCFSPPVLTLRKEFVEAATIVGVVSGLTEPMIDVIPGICISDSAATKKRPYQTLNNPLTSPDATLESRPAKSPLCPECLLDVCGVPWRQGVPPLVHCLRCWTVYHSSCAITNLARMDRRGPASMTLARSIPITFVCKGCSRRPKL